MFPCFVGLALLTCCGGSPVRVVVAAGTTLVDSGLIDLLAADFESTHPDVELSVVGDSSASILALARNGAADVTITHAPDLEAEFIGEGRASVEHHVFSSRFILVGPPGDVDGMAGRPVAEAFARLVEAGDRFVSRSDGSGTNLVELKIWKQAGIDPAGMEWYIETGQGMGPTLQVASERAAFTLSELGSFLTARPSLDLVDAGVDRQGLANPYRAMAVAGSPVEADAEAFVDWLVSDAGREALRRANTELFGDGVVFEPAAAE